jgi:hypothetical protein
VWFQPEHQNRRRSRPAVLLHWPEQFRQHIFATDRQPSPEASMIEVIWRGGVFLLFTVLVYFVCMWFVRIEEEKQRRRTKR